MTPINYAVEGGSLLFRTAEGNKLLSVVMGSDVAFEIDHYGGDSARTRRRCTSASAPMAATGR